MCTLILAKLNERERFPCQEDIEHRRRTIEDLIATVKFDQVAVQRFKEVTTDKETYINFIQTMATLDERVAQVHVFFVLI